MLLLCTFNPQHNTFISLCLYHAFTFVPLLLFHPWPSVLPPPLHYTTRGLSLFLASSQSSFPVFLITFSSCFLCFSLFYSSLTFSFPGCPPHHALPQPLTPLGLVHMHIRYLLKWSSLCVHFVLLSTHDRSFRSVKTDLLENPEKPVWRWSEPLFAVLSWRQG